MPEDHNHSPEEFATPLRRLQYLMMGCLDTETDESREQIRQITESNKLKKKKDRRPLPIGHAKGSELHKAAEILNVPRVNFDENDADTCPATTIDMFIDEEIEDNMAKFIIFSSNHFLVIFGPAYTMYTGLPYCMGQEKCMRRICFEYRTFPCHVQNRDSPGLLG